MPDKIIVAAHGIGEQVRSETTQAVANQLCRYCGLPPSMPLGRFTAELIAPAAVPPAQYTLRCSKFPAAPREVHRHLKAGPCPALEIASRT